jgi:hypothetical protein
MTTKKQKREAAEAKRAAFEAQFRADGLAAQAADRARRETRSLAMKEEVQRINDRHEQILNAGIANMIDDFGTLMATVPLAPTVRANLDDLTKSPMDEFDQNHQDWENLGEFLNDQYELGRSVVLKDDE